MMSARLLDKRIAFQRAILASYGMTPAELCVIVRERRHSLLMRVGALRNLIGSADLSITHGRCYLERRRLVRKHYGV